MTGNAYTKWGLIAGALVLGLPVAFFVLFVIMQAVTGSIRDADNTKAKPNSASLVGRYEGSAPHAGDAVVVLNADHTALISQLPTFETFEKPEICRWDGNGTWGIGGSQSWEVEVVLSSITAGKGFCPASSEPLRFSLKGQREPYEIYVTIGDPDSSERITLKKNDAVSR